MSELINNSRYRKERLKELILKLHKGESPESVRQQLIESLQNIPYGEVVEDSMDIRDMLNAGEQPVHVVLAAIKKLSGKGILEVIAPFIPAPLLDKSLSLNYQHWLNKKGEEEYLVYFKK